LREHENEFNEAGAALAAIGLGDAKYARFFREEAGITFSLLIDENRVAYKAAGLKSGNLFHLLRSDNSAARQSAREAGHRQHRAGRNLFQLGGSFVFAPGNRDIYAHLNKTFGDNAPVEALLGAVRNAKSAPY